LSHLGIEQHQTRGTVEIPNLPAVRWDLPLQPLRLMRAIVEPVFLPPALLGIRGRNQVSIVDVAEVESTGQQAGAQESQESLGWI
jgi:hypothetical protein